MFGEFLQIISDIFSLIFIEKYVWLLIAVAVGLAAFILTHIVRWFNA